MPNTSTKRKDITPEANGNNLARIDNVQEAKEKEKSEREDIVLWRKPVITLEYFVRESVILLYTYGKKYGSIIIVQLVFFILIYA